MDIAQLHNLLASVRAAPLCEITRWEILPLEICAMTVIRVWHLRADRDTGEVAEGAGRWHIVSSSETAEQVTRTAWLAAMYVHNRMFDKKAAP